MPSIDVSKKYPFLSNNFAENIGLMGLLVVLQCDQTLTGVVDRPVRVSLPKAIAPHG